MQSRSGAGTHLVGPLPGAPAQLGQQGKHQADAEVVKQADSGQHDRANEQHHGAQLCNLLHRRPREVRKRLSDLIPLPFHHRQRGSHAPLPPRCTLTTPSVGRHAGTALCMSC